MLHLRAIEPGTLGLLKSLMHEPLLANTFLVGGTSLALQMGHRLSVDLDLFTHEPFDAEQLFEALRQNYSVQPLRACLEVVILAANASFWNLTLPFFCPVALLWGGKMPS
ncbi:MAG: nucleotidyl transferase AbiEii/AbiGii toxin family protein [Lewinellaceae bacterium]|nr:nucleotidyl transferase AbiEii/AbiGii toxin family protein [Lewinellaceae bacterium]